MGSKDAHGSSCGSSQCEALGAVPDRREQTFSDMQSEIRGIAKGRKSHVDTQTPTWNLRLYILEICHVCLDRIVSFRVCLIFFHSASGRSGSLRSPSAPSGKVAIGGRPSLHHLPLPWEGTHERSEAGLATPVTPHLRSELDGPGLQVDELTGRFFLPDFFCNAHGLCMAGEKEDLLGLT